MPLTPHAFLHRDPTRFTPIPDAGAYVYDRRADLILSCATARYLTPRRSPVPESGRRRKTDRERRATFLTDDSGAKVLVYHADLLRPPLTFEAIYEELGARPLPEPLDWYAATRSGLIYRVKNPPGSRRGQRRVPYRVRTFVVAKARYHWVQLCYSDGVTRKSFPVPRVLALAFPDISFDAVSLELPRAEDIPGLPTTRDLAEWAAGPICAPEEIPPPPPRGGYILGEPTPVERGSATPPPEPPALDPLAGARASYAAFAAGGLDSDPVLPPEPEGPWCPGAPNPVPETGFGNPETGPETEPEEIAASLPDNPVSGEPISDLPEDDDTSEFERFFFGSGPVAVVEEPATPAPEAPAEGLPPGDAVGAALLPALPQSPPPTPAPPKAPRRLSPWPC